MKKNIRKVIAIVGPTACGKTGIGVKLAKEFNGEIVSADSRQVYRGLNIGTGKEGEACKASQSVVGGRWSVEKLPTTDYKLQALRQHLRCIEDVPQWMIDIVDPEEKMTLFDYLPLARKAIDDILSRGKLPIIVGGTGLYVQGLVEGFELQSIVISTPRCQDSGVEKSFGSQMLAQDGVSQERDLSMDSASSPQAPLEMTAKNYDRKQLDQLTTKQLNDILRGADPEKFTTVDKKNRHRLIRAIELAQEGLKPTKIKPDFEVLQIGIDIPRSELHEQIDRRVDNRFKNGMLEEVEGLLKQGVDSEWLLGLGLEYRVISEYLLNCHFDSSRSGGGEISRKRSLDFARDDKRDELNAMSQDLKWKIHQFARRQLTWFRRFPEINWLSDYKEMKRFVKIFLEH